MTYEEFLNKKNKSVQDCGFDISDNKLNNKLFDFQKHIVKIALKKGRYALFEDCGLGKTIQQIEFAYQVLKKYNKPVLIVAPLGVSFQTISESNKFGYDIKRLIDNNIKNEIYITNYERLEKFDLHKFNGVVLDESSILKNFAGKYKNLLINSFKNTKYKLCCTATPSPNDYTELSNHSEFLNISSRNEILARYFIHDAANTQDWRLKKHAEHLFFNFISQWAICLTKPSDLGFNDDGYILPPLNLFEILINVDENGINGNLFNLAEVSAIDFNKALRISMKSRMDKVVEIENSSNEHFIIWINQNEEGSYLKKLLPNAIEVKGNDKTEYKEEMLMAFANGEFKTLITKKKIAQYGMNFQKCNNEIFPSIDFSFEGVYQAIRRIYRFNQKKECNIYLFRTSNMNNVINKFYEKQNNFNLMLNKLIKNQNEYKKAA